MALAVENLDAAVVDVQAQFQMLARRVEVVPVALDFLLVVLQAECLEQIGKPVQVQQAEESN